MGGVSIRSVLGVFSLIFGFWPLMVLAPLNWRRNILWGMLCVWSGFAILRILFFIFSISPSKLVIDEPLDTIIFLITGGILFIIYNIRNAFSKSKNLRHGKRNIYAQPLHSEEAIDNDLPESQLVPLCPKCGQKMILRIAKQGPNAGNKFWGCSDYPNCRGIVNIG
ncbi:MAG: topoisomerase DNA-binding C4 zinc finger domain-containing protein [Bacteroidota bacterium]